MKWFGIIIQATSFEFGDRASMFSTISQSKYRSAPSFDKTVINSQRFDMMWSHVQWRYQPDVRGEVTIYEAHQWKIVEDFVTYFN